MRWVQLSKMRKMVQEEMMIELSGNNPELGRNLGGVQTVMPSNIDIETKNRYPIWSNLVT